MKKNRSTRRPVIILLAAVMALPLLAQIFMSNSGLQTAQLVSLYRSIDQEGKLIQETIDIRAFAQDYRNTFHMQRRAYSRAVERCRDRLRNGEDVECPDFNDTSTYVPLDAHSAAPEDQDDAGDAPTPGEVEHRVNNSVSYQRELSTEQRLMLRTYTRAGFCSKTAGIMLYDLCQDILGSSEKAAPVGIQNDNIFLRSKHRVGPSTLKLRLQMIDEAISGLKSKRASVRPMGFIEE